MPLALSAVSQYAVECGKTLHRLHAQALPDGTIPRQTAEVAFPPLPAEVIPAFQRVVETAAGPNVSQVFAGLLGALQVQAARLRDELANLSPTAPPSAYVFAPTLEDRVLEAAVIHARAAALFRFARGKSEEVPVEFEGADRLTALHLMGFEETQESLHATANGRTNFSMLSASV